MFKLRYFTEHISGLDLFPVMSGVTVSENPDGGSVRVKIKLPKPPTSAARNRRPFDDDDEGDDDDDGSAMVGANDNARGLFEVI